MAKDLISVIMPCFNCAKNLFRSVESVLQQDHRALELILVDDCSTSEDTKQSLKKYKKNKKIKVIYRKKNGHISECTNTGIENAEGEFISLLDNDDVLDSQTTIDLNSTPYGYEFSNNNLTVSFSNNPNLPSLKNDFSI